MRVLKILRCEHSKCTDYYYADGSRETRYDDGRIVICPASVVKLLYSKN